MYLFIIGTKTRRTNYRDTEVQGQQQKTDVYRKVISESAVTSPRAGLLCIQSLQNLQDNG